MVAARLSVQLQPGTAIRPRSCAMTGTKSGKTNERFATTRDSHDNLVSTNSSDSGLLIRKK